MATAKVGAAGADGNRRPLLQRIGGLLVVLAALLPFAATRTSGHVHDDHVLLGAGSLVRDPATTLAQLWTADFFGTPDAPRGQSGHWRPLVLLSFRLDHVLAGGSTTGYVWLNRVVTLLCHALAAWALWHLLCALALPWPLALLAAALFAVHPVQVEVAAWASSRTNSLPAALGFLALLIWLRSGGASPWGLPCALLFTAALLAKETAVLFPLLAVPLGRLRGMAWGRALAAPLAGVALALALRAASFGLARAIDASAYTGPAEAATRWLTWLAVVPELLRLLVWPGPPTPLHPFAAVPGFDVRAAAGVLALLLVTALAVLAYRRRAAPAFLATGLLLGTLVLLAPWTAVPTGFPEVAGPLYERYAYAMVVAPALGVAWLLRAALVRRPATTLAAAALLLVAPLGHLAASRATAWTSDEAFARAGLAVAPGSANLSNHLGWALLERHRATGDRAAGEEALQQFERALALDHEHRLAAVNRFIVLSLLGRTDEELSAAASLERRWPDDPHVLDNLAAWHASQGRWESAAALYARSLATGEAQPGTEEKLAAVHAMISSPHGSPR